MGAIPAVPPALASLLGFGDDDTSEDRLREGAYTSPSGTRIKYQFTEVRRSANKRGTVFEFPGVDGGYVQQKGFGPRTYPLICFFTGNNHDLEATAFEAALYEPGRGKLEHPRYGEITNVVPLGRIGRRDDLVREANQSVVETTFWTSLENVYPSARGNPKSEILAALGAFDVEAAQEYDARSDLLTEASKASTSATILSLLKAVSASLQAVADTTTSVRREFADIQSTINTGIDVLIGQPLLLAQQMSNLVLAPSRALAGIQARLDGYSRLLNSMIGSQAGRLGTELGLGVIQASLRRKRSNDFQVAQHIAMNAVAGAVESVMFNEFDTKPEAIEAAEQVLAMFDTMIEWREQAFEDLEQTDTGGAYQQLQQAVAFTEGFLVEASFTLVPERLITLDRNRTVIDLVAELHGTVDDRLDDLINNNDLTGSEILELPAGKTIRYYA